MNEADFAAMGGAILGLLCLVLLVVLVIVVFYLQTLQKALSRVAPRNRLMEPGMVWLSLIPCFNLIWQFFVAIRVPDSLRNEFRDRGRDDGSDYGKSLALTQAVLGLINIVVSNGLGKIPEISVMANLIGGVIGIASFVIFIMFWAKIAAYSNQLAMDDPIDLERRLRKFDDDDDDRGPPPGDGSSEPDPGKFKEGDPGRYQ